MPKGNKKQKTGKRVNFLVIPEQDAQGKMSEPYKLLKEIRDLHHGDTKMARIAMAWRIKTSPDKDGRLVLGKCVKVSDLNREFADYDFIIVLNKEFWEAEEVTKEQRLALLDHEMMHAAPDYEDETGEHKVDERGRFIFRSRGHDFEDFNDIVQRHGIWKRDLQKLAEIIMQKRKAPMFAVDTSDVQASAVVQ